MSLPKETLDALLGLASKPQVGDDADFLALPDGWHLADLEKYGEQPRRKAGLTGFIETASFAAYVNKHKSAATELYGRREMGATVWFRAVLDDHAAEAPGWRGHSATLEPRATAELATLVSGNGVKMDQAAFGRWLEEHAELIAAPAAGQILDIALGLEQTAEVKCVSRQRLEDGSRSFRFEDNRQTNVDVPPRIVFRLAVWEGFEPVEMPARLRYRFSTQNGTLSFQYELINPEAVYRRAFDELRDVIEAATELEALV